MTDERKCTHCGSENVVGVGKIISHEELKAGFPVALAELDKSTIAGVFCLDCGKPTKFEERVI